MNVLEFEASLQTRRYDEIVTVEKAPGYYLGEHKHAFDACALITDGQIDIAVDGVMRSYRVGDVFDVPANTVHTESAGPTGVVYRAGRRHNTAAV
jgi:quercetin dioxygenase-like cupin family protein